MGYPRQEYWTGLPFPPPGDLSDRGVEPGSPALQVDSWLSVTTWEVHCLGSNLQDQKFKMGQKPFNKDSQYLWGPISYIISFISSVQFSRSVMSDSLQPLQSQHTRLPCPSPTPGVHLDSRPLSQWCHPAISSSVVPFSSCPNPSQHQSLFQWVNSSHEVAKVLEFQL